MDWSIVVTVLVTILIFGIIIFIHELGHFLVAKACGIQVNEFALGMGPTILKKQGKNTLYALRAFPIGGFVSMEGEDSSSENQNAFCNKPVWKRILVVLTGPVMNLILGFIVVLVMVICTPLVGSTTVARFEEGALSAQTGLQVGDEIKSINGSPVFVDNDIVYGLLRAEDGNADITVVRDGKTVNLDNVKFAVTDTGEGAPQITIDFKVQAIEKDFFSVMKAAAMKTVSIMRAIWVSLFDLITGNYGINDLSGPIGVGQVVNQALQLGWMSLLSLVAFISINVGIFNFIPFPALDGWRILVLIVEGIRRKPMNPKIESGVNVVGLVLLMGLMVVVACSDVLKLFQ